MMRHTVEFEAEVVGWPKKTRSSRSPGGCAHTRRRSKNETGSHAAAQLEAVREPTIGSPEMEPPTGVGPPCSLDPFRRPDGPQAPLRGIALRAASTPWYPAGGEAGRGRDTNSRSTMKNSHLVGPQHLTKLSSLPYRRKRSLF